MNIDGVLVILRDAALEADEMAMEACMRSKYSVQDYWMCMEFWTQRLHDRIAKESGINEKCPHGPFRSRLSEFKASIRASSAETGGETK